MNERYWKVKYKPIELVGKGFTPDGVIEELFLTLPAEVQHFFRVGDVLKVERCDEWGDQLDEGEE